jgi:hypothetical protein
VALANFAAFVTAMESSSASWMFNYQRWTSISGTPRDVSGGFWNIFDSASTHPGQATAESTATATDGTESYAIERFSKGSGDQFIAEYVAASEEFGPRNMLIMDVLAVQGGLDGTVTTSQTTNLPTAALTRFTDGIGVLPMMVTQTNLGTTNALLNITYTNTDDTTGRSGVIGQSFRGVNYFEPYPQTEFVMFGRLEGTDKGVKSIQSVQLTASTGGAGDFGVWLVKPIAFVINALGQHQYANTIVGWNTPISSSASLIAISTQLTDTGVESGHRHLIRTADR